MIAHMVVMDIPSLDSLADALMGCLADDAVVVVTLPHPSFFNQSPIEEPGGDRYRKVKGYLEHEEWWISTFGCHRHYHRPLEFYVQCSPRRGWGSSISSNRGAYPQTRVGAGRLRPLGRQHPNDAWHGRSTSSEGLTSPESPPIGAPRVGRYQVHGGGAKCPLCTTSFANAGAPTTMLLGLSSGF